MHILAKWREKNLKLHFFMPAASSSICHADPMAFILLLSALSCSSNQDLRLFNSLLSNLPSNSSIAFDKADLQSSSWFKTKIHAIFLVIFYSTFVCRIEHIYPYIWVKVFILCELTFPLSFSKISLIIRFSSFVVLSKRLWLTLLSNCRLSAFCIKYILKQC